MPNNKPLVVFGASNFGDEIAQLFRDINSGTTQWDLIGFLDDDESKIGSERVDLPVLGGRDWLRFKAPKGIHVVVAIGSPPAKKRVVRALSQLGVAFATGVHPTVVTSPYNTIGAGVVIAAGNILTTHVRVEDHVIINLACTVGHYTRLGAYSTINPHVAISGDVDMKEGAFIGTGAAINDKLTIGRGAIVGSGAVVTKDIPPFVTAVGIPARIVKKRDDDLSL